MKDLFGNEIADEESKGKPKGYAGQPGRGPHGEYCRTCAHAYYREMHNRFWKCDLVKATRGPGTDIRAKSPACQFWEKA